MPTTLIQKFQKILNGDKAATIHGPMSPLILTIPWLNKKEFVMDLLTINRGRECFMAVNEKSYRGECARGFREYSQGKVSLQELIHEYDDLEKTIDSFYEKSINLDFKALSDTKLESLTQETSILFSRLANQTIYIEIFDQEMVMDVLGPAGKKVIDEIWEEGTHPTFVSFEGRRLHALCDYLSQEDSSSIRPIQYIYTDYIGSKTPEEISNALTDIQKNIEEKKAEYKKIESEANSRLRNYDEWKKTLTDISLKTVEYMQLMMELRDVRKDIIAKVQVVIFDLANELFTRAGIDTIHSPYVGILEITRGISYLKSNKESIEVRKKGSVSITHHDGRFEVELCDYDSAVNEFYSFNQEEKGQKELKGQVACRGKITGIVRIVLDPHDDKGFQSGDILVTSMTRPEFVPLMKRAGAVVTNEGGVTCHAAIVSRELNIPCIIGTKIATRFLKNGDIVEVDAEKGIVTILK